MLSKSYTGFEISTCDTEISKLWTDCCLLLDILIFRAVRVVHVRQPLFAFHRDLAGARIATSFLVRNTCTAMYKAARHRL